MNIAIRKKIGTRLPLVGLLIGCLSVAASAVDAAVFIAADVQGASTNTYLQADFARWAIGTGSRSTSISKTFSNEIGTSNAVSVVISSSTGAMMQSDHGPASFSSTFRYTNLYNEVLQASGDDAKLLVAFSGLSANTSYIFTFFALDVSLSTSTTSTTTVTSGSGNVPLGSAATYTQGDALSYNAGTLLNVAATTGIATTDATGRITFTITSTNTYASNINQALLNGFTVATIPEPNASIFMAAALVMWAVRRRYLHKNHDGKESAD